MEHSCCARVSTDSINQSRLVVEPKLGGPTQRDSRAIYWANVLFGLTLVDAASMLGLDEILLEAMAFTGAARDHAFSNA